MELKSSYKDVSKEMVLDHMIRELPETPWATMDILDWLPEDDALPVTYSFYESFFGEVLIANTPKGVCYLGVSDNEREFVSKDFDKRFGYANPREEKTPQQQIALDYLNGKRDRLLQFHLKGTPYQIEIWRRLLRIPSGKVISYVTLAGSKEYARAAGTANGRNPIFYLVPCHRVVCTNGKFDRYFWGKDIKKRLLSYENTTGNRSR